MQITIKTDDMELALTATSELTFEDLFKAHQLVTRGTDSLNVSDNETTVAAPESPKKEYAGYAPHERRAVKVAIACPFCGHTGSGSVIEGFHFLKCPECREKLFLAPANGAWGVLDDKGFYYHAEREYHDRRDLSEPDDFGMSKHSNDPEKPDAYSTIPQIETYLDAQGIDHTGVKLKGKLIELIPE